MKKDAEKKEIKFPFEPNKKVKAAFRQETQLRRAIYVMTEAVAKVAADVIDPWEVAKQEHPELMVNLGRLKYNLISERIDLSESCRKGDSI